MGYGSDGTGDTERSRFQTPSPGKGKAGKSPGKPGKGGPPKGRPGKGKKK